VAPLQIWPAGQEEPGLPEPPTAQVPAAPQKRRLVSGSTQVLPQLTRPIWQESWQLPPLQTRPAGQVAPARPAVRPHPVVAPQCWRLVSGSTQVPLQSTRLAWQESWQLPALQTCPLMHEAPTLPEPPAPQAPAAPQKIRLVWGSMQVPPQSRRPTWQETWHVPAVHN
jgi:hypothetical protein